MFFAILVNIRGKSVQKYFFLVLIHGKINMKCVIYIVTHLHYYFLYPMCKNSILDVTFGYCLIRIKKRKKFTISEIFHCSAMVQIWDDFAS